MSAIATIYVIRNRVNAKEYVGVTRFSIMHRWAQHRYSALNRNSEQTVHRAIRKYGADNFEVVAVASCLSEPGVVESDVIKSRLPAYNMTAGGEVTKGRRVAPEVAERIRKANTGKVRTLEQNLEMSRIKRQQYLDNPELRCKAIASLSIKCRSDFEEKRVEGIRRAAAEGRMARPMTPKRLKRQLANLGTPESRKKMAETKCKKVLCLTTGLSYNSLLEAAKLTGIDISGISKVCLGQRKSAGGKSFKFIE